MNYLRAIWANLPLWARIWIKRIYNARLYFKRPKFKLVGRIPTRDAKIYDWQVRETEERSANPSLSSIHAMKLDKARALHREMLKNVRYVSDEVNYGRNEYWATSDEVRKRQTDDCDGQMVYLWRAMRDAGFPDEYIGGTVIEGHVFACIFLDNDFWILDNGSLTFDIVKASWFLPRANIKPIMSFTLKETWEWKIQPLT